MNRHDGGGHDLTDAHAARLRIRRRHFRDEIPFRDDADRLSPLHDDQAPDVLVPHDARRLRGRRFGRDRDGSGGHDLNDGDAGSHACTLITGRG